MDEHVETFEPEQSISGLILCCGIFVISATGTLVLAYLFLRGHAEETVNVFGWFGQAMSVVVSGGLSSLLALVLLSFYCLRMPIGTTEIVILGGAGGVASGLAFFAWPLIGSPLALAGLMGLCVFLRFRRAAVSTS